ncbi:hypothetical protein SAMN04489740_1008 [Arthrobacter alpinus]|uniref:Uncharacterized protein n=1 Tax=Arthrobacter alpinus TaxID=656366 RepID=A0A1H5HGH6_9MICC|nr:hypothetical protein [Arthrobacter alpinus]SEE26990.1 hypothetical protein SAMN04489740_1008 [Arthrobacter alpinus]
MPGPYAHDPILAADPSNPSLVAANASVTIFAVGDPTKTPVTIWDLSHTTQLPNPVTTNRLGFGPQFSHDTIPQLAWEGGGFSGTFKSFKGLWEDAEAAKGAAQGSATSSQESAASSELAATNAATGVATALAATVAEATAAKLAAQQAAALVGAPADVSTAALVGNPATLTGTALSAAIGLTGAPQAKDGHEYVWLAGVIRNLGDGSGWQLLLEGSNHRPIGITSIDTVDDSTGPYGYIRVNYPGVVGPSGMTVTFMAVPDETLARNGFSCGTSVTQTYTDIRISQAAPAASDYVSYNGSAWVSQDGKLTPTFSGGILTLAHEPVPASAQYSINAVARTEFYSFNAPRAAGTLDTGKFSLEVRDNSPRIADYVSFDGTNWSSQDGKFTGFAFDTSTGVLTLTHAAIPLTATQRVSLNPRGATRPVVTSTTSPTSTTTLKIQFVNSAGTVLLTPDTTMRAYVTHGGGTGELVTAPDANMRVFASHGGGNRQWKPSALNTIVYPGSNIWLLGFMGKAPTG